MLLNYHIGRLVLSSLCVGDLVRLVLSSARVAGFSLQHGHDRKFCQSVAVTRNSGVMSRMKLTRHINFLKHGKC